MLGPLQLQAHGHTSGGAQRAAAWQPAAALCQPLLQDAAPAVCDLPVAQPPGLLVCVLLAIIVDDVTLTCSWPDTDRRRVVVGSGQWG